MESFSNKLSSLRNRKGLSQSELAKELGVAQTTYSGWELGREPKYNKLIEISKFFNVPIDYLLENEKENQTTEIARLERELNKEQKEKLKEMCKVMFPDEYKRITKKDA